MPQWLTISRAAKLIGVTRGAMQKKILDGELDSFDGLVSTEQLARAYPAGDVERRLDDDGAYERVSRIKDESFGRRVRERVLPSQEILAQRLFAQGRESEQLRRHLVRYHELVVGIRSRIQGLQQQAPEAALASLGALVDAGLAEVLGADESVDRFAVLDEVLRVMAARITLRPSGKEFLLEGRDSLLAAALKAGATPGYGCGNGNCGLCKARVVSGEVARIARSDYPMSEAERSQGCVLMCAHTAASDVVLEVLEAGSPHDIPDQALVARVHALTPMDDDTLLLHLQTPRSARLRFLAGQRVTLGLAGDLGDHTADLPIASCPCDDRNLQFHVTRNADDGFAQRLFSGAVVRGTEINVRGPWGDFVLEGESPRPLVFVAAGAGFAPIKSLIEHALAVDAAESITLIWAARRGGHYLANQCRAWTDALETFRYLPLDAGTGADAAAAVVASLRTLAADIGGVELYVCGPAGFVASVAAVAPRAANLRTLVT